MVLEANIGSGVLPMIAHWQSSAAAHVPLVANFYVQIFGVAIILLAWSLPQFGFDTKTLPLLIHLVINMAIAAMLQVHALSLQIS